MKVSDDARSYARIVILDRLTDEYEPDEFWEPGGRGDGSASSEGWPQRYALIELNVGSQGDTHWITTHDTPEDAGDYHLSQEGAEGWWPVLLMDLDTGEAFVPEFSITWKPEPEPEAQGGHA